MTFSKQFKDARRVSTPLVCVRTFDARSTMDGIRQIVDKDAALLVWDCVNGIRALNDAGKVLIDTVILANNGAIEATVSCPDALRMIDGLGDKDAIIFFSNLHLQWSEAVNIQAIWNLRDTFKADGNMLVALVNPGANVPTELVNDVLVLEEPLPDQSALTGILTETYKAAKVSGPDSETTARALNAVIGLPAFPAEQSIAMCLDKKSGSLDVAQLWDRKRQIIAQTPGLSVNTSNASMDQIGGLQNVKDFFTRVIHGKDAPTTILFIDEIEKAFAGTGTDLSGVKTELAGSMLTWMQEREIDGSLFLGLPGVSKSELIKALGASHGIPVINFDIAGMQAGIVGSSGSNLRAAQKTVDAISGGRILAIATCNSINTLPGELRRRFKDAIFFFDAPSAEERAAIWKIYRTRYKINAGDQLPNDTGWTGAEIKECCKKAYRLSMTLKESAAYIVPVTISAGDQIRALRMSSSGKYISASTPGLYSFSELPTAATSAAATGRKIREEN